MKPARLIIVAAVVVVSLILVAQCDAGPGGKGKGKGRGKAAGSSKSTQTKATGPGGRLGKVFRNLKQGGPKAISAKIGKVFKAGAEYGLMGVMFTASSILLTAAIGGDGDMVIVDGDEEDGYAIIGLIISVSFIILLLFGMCAFMLFAVVKKNATIQPRNTRRHDVTEKEEEDEL